MQVDFSIELSGDDPTLEIPWSSPEGIICYQNLKLDPGALDQIPEAADYPEVREFLTTINTPGSRLESAKCDVWSTTEIHPEEEIFGEPCKFGGYFDLFFSDPQVQDSFSRNEGFLKDLTSSLRSAPDIPVSTEFLLRRCFYRRGDQVCEGFYFTTYVFGFGADPSEARNRWATALEEIRNCLMRRSVEPISRNHVSRGSTQRPAKAVDGKG